MSTITTPALTPELQQTKNGTKHFNHATISMRRVDSKAGC